jgi:hypothetical protein
MGYIGATALDRLGAELDKTAYGQYLRSLAASG